MNPVKTNPPLNPDASPARLAFSYFDITPHNWYAARVEFAILVSSSFGGSKLPGKFALMVPERRNA